MNEARYACMKFKLRAVLGELEFRDCSQFTSNFELNGIPSASLLVGIGRNLATGKPALIHSAVEKLKEKQDAKVYLQVTVVDHSSGVKPTWPEEEFLIFEGSVLGTGFRKQGSQAHFVIHLMHWLDDLNANSAVSASQHPMNPGDFSFGSIMRTLDAGAGGLSYIPMCDTQHKITDAAVADDFWMNVLHPWLVEVAQDERLEPVIPLLTEFKLGDNTPILAALDRLKRVDTGFPYLPLEMDIDGVNGTAISNGIRESLIKETADNWVNTTLWGKLIGQWAPSYFFSVVPRISDARVVPFTGPLSGEPYQTIDGSGETSCNLNSQQPQSLQGVGIFHGVTAFTGGNNNPAENAIGYKHLAGWFPRQVEETDPTGLILLKSAPTWLSNPVAQSDYSRDSTAADASASNPKLIGTTFDPKSGDSIGNGRQDPADAIKSITDSDFISRYAHQWFALENLKGRMGELAGPLRFDIAPGSNIRIEGAGEKFLGPKDELNIPFYATVVRVSNSINSENSQVGTSFALAHIRTEAENDDPRERMAVSRPPLYKQAWRGCPLQDGMVGPV